jgi:hypothetical protein
MDIDLMWTMFSKYRPMLDEIYPGWLEQHAQATEPPAPIEEPHPPGAEPEEEPQPQPEEEEEEDGPPAASRPATEPSARSQRRPELGR